MAAPAAARGAPPPLEATAIATVMYPARRRLRRWAPGLIALVAALVYANALGNGFVLDDGGVIVRNPLVGGGHAAQGLWRAFASPYWPPAIGGGQYRPLGIASFALDWLLSGGDPRWLHAVNVLWHVGAAVLVWYLAAELLAPAAALAAALLFAVHPVHVEAVANTVGRLEPMAAVLVLGALLAHRRRSWWAPPLFALGLLSKEVAIAFVALAALHDVLLAGAPPREALRWRRPLYAAYGAVAVAYAILLAVVFQGHALRVPALALADATTAERLLTVATVVPHYARLLLVPFALSADYQPGVIDVATSVTPGVVSGVLLTIGTAWAIAHAWRRAPVPAFALAWVPVTLAPVSNVLFTSGVTLAERNLYLPSVGAVLALGWLVERAARRDARPAVAGLAVLVMAFAIRAWTRTPVWRDERVFALTLLEEHPESFFAHWRAARVWAFAGRWPESEREFAVARQLFPRDATLYRESAEVAIARQAWGPALALLDSALRLRPDDAGAWLRVGDLRYRGGDWRGAADAAGRALALAPDSVRGAAIVDAAARALGDPLLAEAAYRRVLARVPASWEARAGLAEVLLAKGDTAAALDQATRAVQLSGGAAPALDVRARAAKRGS